MPKQLVLMMLLIKIHLIFFLNIQHSLLSASLINAESLANDSVIIIIASVVPFEASAHFSCIWPQNQFEL